MAIQIWHNPRCSKSREALKLLEEQGKEVDIYKYLDEAPSVDEIKSVLLKLGIAARDLMRTKETIYKELGLKDIEDEQVLIEAMSKHNKLIERPIIITDTKAIIGRPPQLVLEL
ncbi:MAG: arsenate reductase (glutaredoxin) [Epsilonproteobacteria bacterium 4484_65]|nr:MAG: arsenate reductase (glutaredoxin) [Epsilonproteobacteria bacterium 4484_65]